jgi:hypothetical protein
MEELCFVKSVTSLTRCNANRDDDDDDDDQDDDDDDSVIVINRDRPNIQTQTDAISHSIVFVARLMVRTLTQSRSS